MEGQVQSVCSEFNRQEIRDIIKNLAREEMAAVAEEGARKALESIGLHDESASRDVKDFRNLMMAWREIKSEARKSAVGWFTKLLLSLIIAGIALKTGIVSINFLK